MEDYSWDELTELYNECLTLPITEQATFLLENTETKPALRKRLMEMLAQSNEAEDYFNNLKRDIAEGLETEVPDLAMPGEVINNYKIIKKIGVGGSSQVFAADRVDGQFDKRVAVKIFKKKDATSFSDKTENEKQFLASLNHPSIAQIFDGGTLDNGHPFIIMEFVEGETLKAYLDYKKPNQKDSLKMFSEIGAAVRAAHSNLILHLDIKPGNLIIEKDDRVKLLDFGIAQRLKETASIETVGKLTFNFAAPEQLAGRALSVQTDIYQLGLILYFLLSNGRILEGQKQVLSLLAKVDSEVIKSRELLAIVKKCLQQKPENRYQSVDQLLADIRNFQKKYPISTYSRSWYYRTQKYVQRNSIATLLLSLVFLSLIGGTIISLRQARIADAEKEKAEKAAEIATNTKNFIFELFEETNPSNTKGDTTSIYDFLDKSYKKINSYSGTPEVKAEMYSMIASSYRALGNFDIAEEAITKAQTIFDSLEIYGSESYVALLDNLALFHRDNGNYDKASSLYNKLFRVASLIDIPKDSIYASYLKHYSYVQKTRGLLDSAYQIITKTAELEKRILPDTLNMLYAETLYIKGSIEKDLENYVAALKTLNIALNIVVAVEGEYHPGTQAILNSISLVAQRNKDYDKAQEIFYRQIKIIKKVYGLSHTTLAHAYNNHSVFLTRINSFDSSLFYSKKANAIYKKALKDRPNSDYGLSLKNYGSALSQINQLDSAEHYLNKGVEMLQEVNGPKKYIIDGFFKLGYNYQKKLDTAKAISYFEKAITLKRELNENTDEYERMRDNLKSK